MKVNQSDGFSIMELMIAMAIVSIISVALYSAFEAQVRGQVSQDVSLSMTQSLRGAVDLMASDIRMAGCDPLNGGATIEVASPNELVMTMDIGGGTEGQPDGEIGAGEQIRYAIDADGNLGRAIDSLNDDDLEPLHSEDLECSALNFVYLDADGNPFVPVTDDDRESINAIQVSIVIQSADAGAANPGFLQSITDNTSYTNLQGDEIYKAGGDSYRRFQLSETVDCRNL